MVQTVRLWWGPTGRASPASSLSQRTALSALQLGIRPVWVEKMTSNFSLYFWDVSPRKLNPSKNGGHFFKQDQTLPRRPQMMEFFAGGSFHKAETPGPIGPGVCVQILDPEQCLGN